MSREYQVDSFYINETSTRQYQACNVFICETVSTGNRIRQVICTGENNMQFLKQSTAATVLVGPILDSTGASYASAVIGDFNITKNGTTAAMASAATATHSHNGMYLILFTTGNTNTLGMLDISCNKATYAMPVKTFEVLTASTFDAIVTNAATAAGGLCDIQRMAGTALTGRDIGASVLLSSGTGTGQIALTSGAIDNVSTVQTVNLPVRVFGYSTSNLSSIFDIVGGLIPWTYQGQSTIITDLAVQYDGQYAGSLLSINDPNSGMHLVTRILGSVAVSDTLILQDPLLDLGVEDDIQFLIIPGDGLAPPTTSEISTLVASTLATAHGAGSWATATGFSTHSASDVWAVGTRVLTAGTNIVLAKGTGITGFNDIAATAIVSNGAITTSSGAVSNVTSISQVGGSAIVHTLGKLWTLDGDGNAIAPASATTAIKSKTDNLPSDPADESLIIAATDAIITLLGTSGNAATIGGAIDVAISEANAAHNIVADGTSGNPALYTIVSGLSTFDVSSDIVLANVQKINDSTEAADNLGAMYSSFVHGTAQAGAASVITLQNDSSSEDDYYQDQAIFILSGTGAKQTNRIASYNGTTKDAFVKKAWVTVPDDTSVYFILGRIG